MVLGMVLGVVAEERRRDVAQREIGAERGSGAVRGRGASSAASASALAAAAPQPSFYTVILTSLPPHALLHLNLKPAEIKTSPGSLMHRLHVS